MPDSHPDSASSSTPPPDSPSGSGRALHLFKTRRFLPLFIVQLTGAFNDNFFKNAFVILVTFHFARTRGWNTAVVTQIIAALFALPFFVFSAVAGQLADKFEKSRIVRLTKVWEIIILVFGSAALLLDNPWMLFVTIFLLGTQAAFFGPLKYALLPQHLREDELVPGNAIFESVTYIAILGGTLLGGLLVGIGAANGFPTIGSYWVCGVLLVCAVIGWASSLGVPAAPSETPDLKVNPNIFTATAALIRFTARRRRIFRAILGISWFWLIGIFWLTLTPAYVESQLHSGVVTVTTLLVIFAVGIGVGSMACNKILRGEATAKFVPLAGLMISLLMIDAALLTAGLGERYANETFSFFSFTGARLCIDLLGIAVCGGIFSVPLYALMQIWSPPAHRSRIIAANNVVNSLFMAGVALVCGALFAIGVPAWMLILLLAIVNAAIAIYIIALVPEAVIHTFLRWSLQVLFKVEVRGMENFKRAGKRRVIIANHTSFLDAALLTAFLPDRPTFAISTDFAGKWWLRPFFWAVSVYPLDPEKPMSIKTLTALARAGTPIAIFPEGRLTVTGGIMKVYEGPGLIADRANADLVPVQIDGAMHTIFSRMSGKIRRRWAPKITLTILPPRKFHPPPGVFGRDGRQHMARELYDILAQINVATADSNVTLFQGLVDAAIRHGHGTPILDDPQFKPVTYRRLLAASLFLGPKLCAGTGPGEPVGLLIANSTAAVGAFFGVQSMGRVCAMLNYSAGPASVAAACRASRLRVVLTARKFVEIAKLEPLLDAMRAEGVEIRCLEDVAKKTPADYLRLPFYLRNARWIAARRQKKTIAALAAKSGDSRALRPAGSGKPAGSTVPPMSSTPTAMLSAARSRLVTHFEKFARPASPLADTPAVILFTSGSSGAPKGVVLSHRNLHANRHQLAASVDVTSSDRLFACLPVFHAFGLTGGIILPLLHGTPTFMYPTPLHYGIIPELIYQTNSTIVFGTGTFLAGYARRAHPYDFFSVRYMFSGAEKLKDELRQYYTDQFGVRVFEAYGATETAPGLCINTPMHNRPGTVGPFLPGIEWRLEPVPGIARGGRLWVRGPNIMLGYLLVDDPGKITPPPDGWYDTGDIVDVDADGYVTIVGRAKRFAKLAGEMVSLTAVEELAAATWPDHQHAALSRPHPQKGEEIILVTDHPSPQRADILAKAREKGIAELYVPRLLLPRETLPLLGSGKPDYVALEKEYKETA
ncbi:MAG: MFS transporter [Opitutaceae bacterium]|jgi:acyl-[acyl-carrier-protein]-phospholipid O-acyltransferase/long-chain-fatty-acid--[acyl-carrier-protein] ligase|nr:MFS transporter [Opitutaceae bacterium]